LFLAPFPNKKELSNYYKNNFNVLSKQQIRRIKNRAKQIIKQILIINSKSKTILDIGCGEGHLLNEAKKKNFQVYGIEPSKIAVKKANYIIEINNMNIDKRKYVDGGETILQKRLTVLNQSQKSLLAVRIDKHK